MRRLPPLNSLRAFEAAGRHLSFSKAADELCVTPAAISQQIKIMEDYFGEPLFIRITRGLKLSEPGAQLLPYVSEAMDQLSLGVQLSMRKNERSVLTVSLTRTFGSKWLVPRLGSFYAEHPNIDIRLDGTNTLADFEKDDVDVAIRYGDGNYRDLISEKLLDNHIFPVCSPALLKGAKVLTSLNDLQDHTLLHMEWTSASDTAPHWPTWLQAVGAEVEKPESGPRFSDEAQALQAAIEGMGVLLASSALCETDLQKGTLIRPFGSMQASNHITYYLVYPRGNASNQKVQAFCSWIKNELNHRQGRLSK